MLFRLIVRLDFGGPKKSVSFSDEPRRDSGAKGRNQAYFELTEKVHHPKDEKGESPTKTTSNLSSRPGTPKPKGKPKAPSPPSSLGRITRSQSKRQGIKTFTAVPLTDRDVLDRICPRDSSSDSESSESLYPIPEAHTLYDVRALNNID